MKSRRCGAEIGAVGMQLRSAHDSGQGVRYLLGIGRNFDFPARVISRLPYAFRDTGYCVG